MEIQVHMSNSATSSGNPKTLATRVAPVSESDGSGLFDGFEAYRTPTQSDYRRLLKSGVIVPDANVLLNLYRYNEQAREALLAVLNKIRDRLWVPHQVIVEFWRNRETVLQDPRAIAATIADLEAQQQKAATILREWANRVNLSRQSCDQLVVVLQDAFSAVSSAVREFADNAASEFLRDTNKDPVITRLTEILEGRVGPPFDRASQERVLAEARRRIDSRIPPGYKDAAKDPDRAAGDYIIWLQTIQHIQTHPSDVLFVTGDVKEDWWRRERGESRGPLPELADEMRKEAGVNLYMLRTESMILQARQILNLDISDKSVEDIGRIDRLSETFQEELPKLLLETWPEILSEIRNRRKTAWILLRNGMRHLTMEEDVLTVHFDTSQNAKAFIASHGNRVFADFIADTLDYDIKVRAESLDGNIYEDDENEKSSQSIHPVELITPKGSIRSLITGDVVHHSTYGDGRVVAVRGEGHEQEARVVFGPEFGTKNLLVSYAPLSLVTDTFRRGS